MGVVLSGFKLLYITITGTDLTSNNLPFYNQLLFRHLQTTKSTHIGLFP